MSFGFSDKIKKILGFQDAPMENEMPDYLKGADFENTKSEGFSDSGLAEFKKPSHGEVAARKVDANAQWEQQRREAIAAGQGKSRGQLLREADPNASPDNDRLKRSGSR